jgi:hypothetical protein
MMDGAHAAAAPSHLFRSKGGPRESLDPGHEFGRDAGRGLCAVSRRGVGGCSATRACRRRQRACSDTHHGRGGNGFSASPQCDPFVRRHRPLLPVWSRSRTNSHTVVRPPLLRKTPEGPETRPGGWFRRTKGGGRPSQVLFYPPGKSWLRSINQAPHADPELSRWCRARRPTRFSNRHLPKGRWVFFEIGD